MNQMTQLYVVLTHQGDSEATGWKWVGALKESDLLPSRAQWRTTTDPLQVDAYQNQDGKWYYIKNGQAKEITRVDLN